MAEKTVKSPNPRISVLGVITFILFLICMVPFVLVVINSSKTAKEIIENPIAFPADWGQMIRNVTAIFTDGTIDYVSAFFDSVIVTTGSLFLIVLTSSMTAWVLVRNRTRWSSAIFMLFVAAMVIPFQVVMFPLVGWLKKLGNFLGVSMLGSFTGVFLACTGFGCSLLFSSALSRMSPSPWKRPRPSTDAAGQPYFSGLSSRYCRPLSLPS